jgi:hypothetical protein
MMGLEMVCLPIKLRMEKGISSRRKSEAYIKQGLRKRYF